MNQSVLSKLQGVDFVRACFRLRFLEPYRLTPESALRLRRNFRQALSKDEIAYFQRLLDPPISSDPLAVRRFQRPSPLFAIAPPQDLPRQLNEGEVVDLEVVFWGEGIHLLGEFALLLQALGRIGWHRSQGRFALAQIEGVDPSGVTATIWRPGQSPFGLAPAVLSVDWWLQDAAPRGDALRLSFVTPARLMAGGRPLFQPTFARLFPFALRRVTSMLHACCAVDLVDDPLPILQAASTAVEEENTLRWSDWRTLEREDAPQDLGGVAGSLTLRSEAMAQFGWVLSLASLMNLGKGASYGAGRFRLDERL